jgi:hypothetical protein
MIKTKEQAVNRRKDNTMIKTKEQAVNRGKDNTMIKTKEQWSTKRYRKKTKRLSNIYANTNCG